MDRIHGGGGTFFNSVLQMQTLGHLGDCWLVGGPIACDVAALLPRRNGHSTAKCLEPWAYLPPEAGGLLETERGDRYPADGGLSVWEAREREAAPPGCAVLGPTLEPQDSGQRHC